MTTSTPTPPSRRAIVEPPPGCDSCAFGDTTYRRQPNGMIVVPIEALPGLLTVSGFVLLALEELPPPAPLEQG